MLLYLHNIIKYREIIGNNKEERNK